MISIVCPCFNEGAVIADFVRRLQKVLGDSVGEYELLCINDGSTDEKSGSKNRKIGVRKIAKSGSE